MNYFDELAKVIGDRTLNQLRRDLRGMDLNVTDDEIIDQISAIRTKNNINWMQILRIALKHAPDETRLALASVHAADTEVTDLVRMLLYPSVKTS